MGLKDQAVVKTHANLILKGPSLFSFPSRHHPLPSQHPATFEARIQQPTGLHPKLDITIPRKHLVPPKDSCALHAYFTMPSAIFLDRYQLSETLFLQSQNLIALRSLSGETDLEAPDWVVEQWGSAALLELAHPVQDTTTSLSNDAWKITIPTHLRYVRSDLKSNSSRADHTGSDHEVLDVPYPVVFWACEAEEGLKMSVNPFDRVNLGYDGLFGPKTMFYHIPAAVEQKVLSLEVRVPVLDPSSVIVTNGWVTGGTAVMVLLGFAWVVWQLASGIDGKQRVKKAEMPSGGKKDS